MPVSGNEETGVKPVSWKSSDYIADIPIKKRRFPLVQPTSPPPEESSASQVETDSNQDGQSSICKGTSIPACLLGISDGKEGKCDMQVAQTKVSLAVASLETCGGNKNSVCEKKKLDVDDENAKTDVCKESQADYKERKISICSVSSVDREIKEKVVAADKDDNIPCIAEKTEVKLEPNEALSLSVVKETYDQQAGVGKSKSGNAKLSLGLAQGDTPAVMGQNEGSQTVQEGLEPISLNLFLSNGESSQGDIIQSNKEDPNLHANRSNWDLNTTLDSWENSASGVAEGQLTADRVSAGDGDLVEKPFICSPMVVPGDTGEKQILEESEHRSTFSKSSTLSCQKYIPEDSLYLRLSPSCIPFNLNQEPSCSSVEVGSGRVLPNVSMLRGLSADNLNRISGSSFRTEPSEDSIKHDPAGAKTKLTGFSDFKVKPELNDNISQEVLKSSNNWSLKPVDPRSIKSEPFLGIDEETMKTLQQPLDHSNKIVLQAQDQDVEKPTCLTNFSIRCGQSGVLEDSMLDKSKGVSEDVHKKACEGHEQVAPEMISGPAGPIGNEEYVVATADAEMTDENVDKPEQFRVQLTNKLRQELCANGEGCVSDEEKINIPGDMLEEDSYGSDFESDGNHDLNVSMITEQNHEEEDYEDGEVREQLVHTAEEGPTYEKTEEKFIETNLDDKINDCAGLLRDGDPSFCQFGKNDTRTEDTGEANDETFVDHVDLAQDRSTDKDAGQDSCLQELPAIEMPSSEPGRSHPVQKGLLDTSEGRVAEEVQRAEKESDKSIDGSQGPLDIVPPASEENIEKSIMVDNNETALCKKESSLDGDNTAKDVDGGGNRSRIINLARSSNVSPPGNSRHMPDKLLSSRPGRERLPDIALEQDNLHPRGRDEIYNISSHKFTRARHQDQLSRNSRFNYGRGRGRVSGRGNSLNDWETERDFGPEYYHGPTDFRLPRHKYASGVAEAEIGCNNYNIEPDGKFVGSGRGRRRLLNDEAPTFRRGLSIRRSPGGRNGPARSFQGIHRVPLNISPNRCAGDDGSEVVGLRNGEKFVRGFPDDGTGHGLTRNQHPYDGNGNFFRGNRNFSSAHRRGGFSRIRSKSPIRSRSPGPWSSPRRRSPDGFGGRPEFPHRRSGAIYRMGRMRSPDPPCYPGEMLMGRHGSPPYPSRPSNDLREVESRRDHCQPRSVIPGRSAAGHGVLRNNRRFDIVDPREGNDGDEFFGPMHPPRFSELGGEANSEERRRFSERRGPVRSFRPPYDGTDGGSFHLNTEDGPRPFRFCPEDDPDFHERGNREFDRRIKIRPGNVPRRTRGMEDEEGNYRHGGQVMYDDGFDDMSRVKRKRF